MSDDAARDHTLPGGLSATEGERLPTSLFLPASSSGAARRPRRVLLFFIPGNPGLIEFYGPFLAHLRRLLDESGAAADVYGTSLAGFDDADHAPPFRAPDRPPRDVADQVQFLQRRLATTAAGAGYDAVVLLGHSVGAYLACELVHGGGHPAPAVRAAVLLFPTIVHIARAPAGRRMELLRTTPLLDRHAHRAAALALALVPAALLRLALRACRVPPHAAGPLLRWLKSRDGVWQALHMGKDEMRLIAEDRWGGGFWEDDDDYHDGGGGPARATRFFLLYGRDDHWVDNAVRDDFIAKRAAAKGRRRATVVVDESGVLPHAFSIHHSEPVAEKVKVWIDEVLETLGKGDGDEGVA